MTSLEIDEAFAIAILYNKPLLDHPYYSATSVYLLTAKPSIAWRVAGYMQLFLSQMRPFVDHYSGQSFSTFSVLHLIWLFWLWRCWTGLAQHQNSHMALTRCNVCLQCQPTFISIFSYCMFWFIVFVAVIAKWWRGSLTDAFYKIKKQENKRRAKLGLAKMTKAEEEQFVKEQLDNRYQVCSSHPPPPSIPSCCHPALVV